jgi:prenyltransferase beta subunit
MGTGHPQECAPTDVERSIAAAIESLRRTQEQEGFWQAPIRYALSLITFAAALRFDGERPESETLQDIASLGESWATPGGAIADHPGGAPIPLITALWLPLLECLRPHSPAIARARDYLGRSTPVRSTWPLAIRWMCGTCNRAALVRAASEIAVPNPVAFDRFSPVPGAADFMVLVEASIRRLVGDETPAARHLYDSALARRKNIVFPDGTYQRIDLAAVDLLFTDVFALAADRERAANALRRASYLAGGWLTGSALGNETLDTGMSVQALLEAGVPVADPMVKRARQFLRAAVDTDDGLCGLVFSSTSGRRSIPDTDDSGTVWLALSLCGDPPTERALHALIELQEPSGGFSTFASPLARPNCVHISNTSKMGQLLVGRGLDRADDAARRAVDWIRSRQQPDGSWWDGWCARYVYGTTMALEGLLRARPRDVGGPVTARAIEWLLSRQNPDGGWGEDFHGESSASTVEHTGMALVALGLEPRIADRARAAILAGARWISGCQRPDGGWNAAHVGILHEWSSFSSAHYPVYWAMRGLSVAQRLRVTR